MFYILQIIQYVIAAFELKSLGYNICQQGWALWSRGWPGVSPARWWTASGVTSRWPACLWGWGRSAQPPPAATSWRPRDLCRPATPSPAQATEVGWQYCVHQMNLVFQSRKHPAICWTMPAMDVFLPTLKPRKLQIKSLCAKSHPGSPPPPPRSPPPHLVTTSWGGQVSAKCCLTEFATSRVSPQLQRSSMIPQVRV